MQPQAAQIVPGEPTRHQAMGSGDLQADDTALEELCDFMREGGLAEEPYAVVNKR